MKASTHLSLIALLLLARAASAQSTTQSPARARTFSGGANNRPDSYFQHALSRNVSETPQRAANDGEVSRNTGNPLSALEVGKAGKRSTVRSLEVGDELKREEDEENEWQEAIAHSTDILHAIVATAKQRVNELIQATEASVVEEASAMPGTSSHPVEQVAAEDRGNDYSKSNTPQYALPNAVAEIGNGCTCNGLCAFQVNGRGMARVTEEKDAPRASIAPSIGFGDLGKRSLTESCCEKCGSPSAQNEFIAAIDGRREPCQLKVPGMCVLSEDREKSTTATEQLKTNITCGIAPDELRISERLKRARILLKKVTSGYCHRLASLHAPFFTLAANKCTALKEFLDIATTRTRAMVKMILSSSESLRIGTAAERTLAKICAYIREFATARRDLLVKSIRPLSLYSPRFTVRPAQQKFASQLSRMMQSTAYAILRPGARQFLESVAGFMKDGLASGGAFRNIHLAVSGLRSLFAGDLSAGLAWLRLFFRWRLVYTLMACTVLTVIDSSLNISNKIASGFLRMWGKQSSQDQPVAQRGRTRKKQRKPRSSAVEYDSVSELRPSRKSPPQDAFDQISNCDKEPTVIHRNHTGSFLDTTTRMQGRKSWDSSGHKNGILRHDLNVNLDVQQHEISSRTALGKTRLEKVARSSSKRSRRS